MRVALRIALASLALIAFPAHATLVVSSTGTIASTDSSQLGRLSRNGVESTWAAPKAFPGTINAGATYNYDLVDATFGANALQTIYYEITYTLLSGADGNIFSVGYLNSYNPASQGTNYLGDSGTSPALNATQTYQVIVGAGGTLLLNFHNTAAGSLPVGYSYTVSAFSDPNRGENFLTAGVPEPSTWLMMLIGFAGAGLAVRRRRGKVRAPLIA